MPFAYIDYCNNNYLQVCIHFLRFWEFLPLVGIYWLNFAILKNCHEAGAEDMEQAASSSCCNIQCVLRGCDFTFHDGKSLVLNFAFSCKTAKISNVSPRTN